MSSSRTVALAGAAVRSAGPALIRARRAVLVRRIQVLAAAARADVDLDIALDAEIGRGLRLTVEPGSHNQLRIGPGVRLGEGVVLHLGGGQVTLGGWSDLRRGVVLNIAGNLTVGERTVLGAGSTVHCAHQVQIGDRVAIGEYTTVVDTSHQHTALDRPMVYDTLPGAVHIGDDVFIGAKSTLTRRCRIGNFCVVGAGSVVVGEVPARSFISGIPATYVRTVELPWE